MLEMSWMVRKQQNSHYLELFQHLKTRLHCDYRTLLLSLQKSVCFLNKIYNILFLQMQCNIHSCLRLEEWVLIIYMMPGGSQISTPTLSKFNHGNVSFFYFYLGEFSFFTVSLWLNMQSQLVGREAL